MGSSQPTLTSQIDAFASSWHDFRAWLPRREQDAFDRLVAIARGHVPALNVSEDLDLTRRIILCGLLDQMAANEALAKRTDELSRKLGRLEAAVQGLAQASPA